MGEIEQTRGGFNPQLYTDCNTSHDSKDFIGRGSFGTVYRARLGDLTQASELQPAEVAMKVVKLSKESLMKKYQMRELEFHREGEGGEGEARMFDHPNIIRYFAFVNFLQAKTHCIYMELCEQTLTQKIEEGHEMPEDQRDFIKHVALGICSGVNHLHTNGIIHRDINPDNILLKDENCRFPAVKVADFNVYTDHDEEQKTTMAHTVNVGTFHYMAKEVRQMLTEEKTVYGCPADVWSIGAVIYETATKRKFNELTYAQLSKEQLFPCDVKLMTDIKDQQLRSVLLRCLQWDPAKRDRCSELLSCEYLDSAVKESCKVSSKSEVQNPRMAQGGGRKKISGRQ